MAQKSSNDDTGVGRLKNKSRKYHTSLTRRKWRTTAFKRPTLTAIQKNELKVKRQQRAAGVNAAIRAAQQLVWDEAKKLEAEFGAHDVKYYHSKIIQEASGNKSKRKVSRWNAYLRSEVQRLNEDLPAGERKKAPYYLQEISRRWNAMTTDEQVTATDPLLEDLEELREMKKLATHNVPAEAFGDAKKTIGHIEDQIHSLHARTGTEVIFMAVRSSATDYLQPHVVATSERGVDFFRMSTKAELTTTAIQFEGYCLSGTTGLVNTYAKDVARMKSETSALINDCLLKTARLKIGRINYKDFNKITVKHGVVIEGWPLKIFCSPSDVPTRNELQILFNAWKSGTARFRQLNTAEWEDWSNKYFQSAMDVTNSHTALPGTDDADAASAATFTDPNTATPAPNERPENPDRVTTPSSGDDQSLGNERPEGPEPAQDTRDPVNATTGPGPAQDIRDPATATTGDKRPSLSENSRAPKRRALANAPAFINMAVTGADGAPLTQQGKKPRKRRSDAGVKKGKRGATAASDASAGPTSSA